VVAGVVPLVEQQAVVELAAVALEGLAPFCRQELLGPLILAVEAVVAAVVRLVEVPVDRAL